MSAGSSSSRSKTPKARQSCAVRHRQLRFQSSIPARRLLHLAAFWSAARAPERRPKRKSRPSCRGAGSEPVFCRLLNGCRDAQSVDLVARRAGDAHCVVAGASCAGRGHGEGDRDGCVVAFHRRRHHLLTAAATTYRQPPPLSWIRRRRSRCRSRQCTRTTAG